MSVRTILIVEAAHAANLSIVAREMGYPQDFTQGRKLCAFAEAATPETPASHFFTNDAAMPTETEQKFRLMAAGEFMPQVVWANTEITEVQANTAAAALSVISEAGGGSLGDVAMILQARGLKFVPEPEI